MGHRVRFANPSADQVYLYSPTSSTSSRSPGPATPPSPHSSLPQSSVSSPLEVILVKGFHDALRLNSKDTLKIDLSVDPRTNPSLISSDYFSSIQGEDATIPPTGYVELWSRWLPWVIEITPKTGPHVTVYDMLCGLYDALHARMTEEEYHASTDLSRFPGIRDDVDSAFKKRCDKIMEHNVGLAEKERNNGRRRLDLLRGNNIFYGLSVDPNTEVVKFSVKDT
ncbi:hypothetical protein D9758_013260 [Tetrapyrgos nigripes]|uniref:DUF6699 domain-containing protein n=1 Tax=Tetrapyrgos nigripes TaxID=182062 RepID=A0A8H5CMA2_9AGAR|nr:hypothetical protein D9758_013260 [Tetrapyrgos nigripes]